MKERNRTIDFLKWLLLGIMVFDHAAMVFWPGFVETIYRQPGYLGFPLFGLLWAYTYRPGLDRWKLLFWAVMAQIPYTLIFGPSLNILFSFLIASLPLPWAALIGVLVTRHIDGGIVGISMLFFARHATLPPLPQVPFKVRPAKAFPAFYGGHLAMIVWAWVLLPH